METPLIILLTSSEDEDREEERERQVKQKTTESERFVSLRSINQEHRMVSDLGGLDFMKKKKKKKKNIRNQAQEQVTQADTIVPVEVEAINASGVGDNVNSTSKITDNGASSRRRRNTRMPTRAVISKPRYFDPPHGSWSTCSNCGEEDHSAANCTMLKRQKRCSLCGSSEHIWKHCRKGRRCFVCKERGHLASDCRETRRENNICLRCGNSGHNMFSCRNDYSPDDLKKIQCYICKSFGHLCCVDWSDIGPRQVSCYNCGESGHLGSVCTKLCGVPGGSKSPALVIMQEGALTR
ncbi:zf-CCHC domain-containing protein [Cephalotus follicularis]|uniref:Zf-CCHC domain-containing protein n=1 Tax=Cephalotus follicularis TaxID=3775 RepID=A0A1Q3D102_CEPFO|nr:zf-CCHC domain-containing protein [Cephalotus follicularis]